MNVSCFISADPAARNATRLYDKNVDSGEFWYRDDLSAPLPTCSTSSLATSQCMVCVNEIVHAVCCNLPEGVMMMMEGDGVSVNITKGGCPEPPPVGCPEPPPVDGFPVWGIVVTLGIILIFGIIFILGKRFLKRVCRGSVFQNNHSSRTNRPSSQSLTQSDAGAIMDNVINEKVSTDASPFRSERSDPKDPGDVELTPLSVCHRETRSA